MCKSENCIKYLGIDTGTRNVGIIFKDICRDKYNENSTRTLITPLGKVEQYKNTTEAINGVKSAIEAFIEQCKFDSKKGHSIINKINIEKIVNYNRGLPENLKELCWMEIELKNFLKEKKKEWKWLCYDFISPNKVKKQANIIRETPELLDKIKGFFPMKLGDLERQKQSKKNSHLIDAYGLTML